MKEKLKCFFGLLLILCGIGIYSYPIVITQHLKWQMKKSLDTFDKRWTEPSEEQFAGKKDFIYKKIRDYNQSIYESNQDFFPDAWSCETLPILFRDFEEENFGYIDIPKMNVKLPLYLGASESNLRKGAAVLGQTSVPIGGANTNSVIAGHRGYQGAPYFREIEKLSIGDMIYITNPWEQLSYQVVRIKIIVPQDNDSVKIQEGKDMVTLITCHPYRSKGKYRYLVYCERKKGEEIKIEQNASQSRTMVSMDDVPFESSNPDIQREKNIRKICAVIILIFCIYIIFFSRARKGD